MLSLLWGRSWKKVTEQQVPLLFKFVDSNAAFDAIWREAL